ncbi:MAG: phytoene desaturase family protein, partial [Nitrospinota bacterium]
LIVAGYLSKAGLNVCVLEHADRVGGCVQTWERFGCRINPFSFNYGPIHATPVIEDLELSRHGLEFLWLDPFTFVPMPDGRHLLFHRDLDRTCQGIAEQYTERDAEDYRRFIEFWEPVYETVGYWFLEPPPAFEEILASLEPAQADLMRHAMHASANRLLREFFDEEALMIPQCMWGPALHRQHLDEPGSAFYLGAQAYMHRWGLSQPVGGSGRLTEAMAEAVRGWGGTIRTRCTVSGVIQSGGEVKGVRLADGETLDARVVVTAVDPRQALSALLAPEDIGRTLHRKARALHVFRGGCVKVLLAASELPDYSALPSLGPAAHHVAIQAVCPSLDYLEASYLATRQGVLSDPAFFVTTQSVLDPSLGAPDRYPIGIETRYAPFEMSDGSSWEDVKEREGRRAVEVLGRFAPNFPRAVTDMEVISPVDFETLIRLPTGDGDHLHLGPDQRFRGRPMPEVSGYRTPVRNLYITGAGTHPGSGVTGAPGYNAAKAVLDDLGKPMPSAAR